MHRSEAGLDAELRISPKLVLGAFVAVACIVYLGVELLCVPWEIVSAGFSLTLVLFGAAFVGWMLDSWRPLVGRWATIVLLGGIIYAGAILLDAPTVLVLAALPVALATPMVGIGASAIVALVETVLLLADLGHGAIAVTAEVVYVGCVGIWATLGIMVAMHLPTHKLIAWLEDYFERSVRYVEEARGQKEELEQALEGFATANRQLALANERATALRASAEEAQRTKAAFVANVSHEFRTPLNMIIGLVDLMIEAPEAYAIVPSPEMREDLEVIHRNCEHLAAMVDDVLDLTRVEAGRLSLHRERVDLGEVIHSSVDVVAPLLEKKQLSLTVAIPEDLPQVYCDRTRVQQVVLNLVSNAARFTDSGGIDIVVLQDDHEVDVSVRDTGTGITPEDAKLIFHPFEQGKLWHGRGGSGLGLSLSKQFVELHGGEMHLESTVGVGTTICFTLPISPPLERDAAPGHAIQPDWIWHERAFRVSRGAWGDNLAKPCILVHDEGGDLRPWLDHYRDQVELIVADNRDQIRGILDAYPASAVLLNTTDPFSLLELAESARGSAAGTPIVACSIPHRLDRALEAGAIGHLTKPVTRDDLASAVSAVGRPVHRVLIVDDDPDVLRLFSRTLNLIRGDLDVTTATSGREAIAQLRDTSPDLMLLDIVMPDMDGWQVLEALRGDPGIEQVPTFLISAQDSVDQVLTSTHLLVTIDSGIPLSTVLAWSCDLSTQLLTPGAGPGPMLG